MTQQNPNAPTCAPITHARPAEPTDLAVAISVAQKMLATYGRPNYSDPSNAAQAHGSVTESLRILLRALGAEDGAQ